MIDRKRVLAKAQKILAESRDEKLKNDPVLRAIDKELKELEKRENELRLEIRKIHFDSLSPEEKRIRTLIGWNPYENEEKRIIHRDVGFFTKKD